jgi:hypothetical protein
LDWDCIGHQPAGADHCGVNRASLTKQFFVVLEGNPRLVVFTTDLPNYLDDIFVSAPGEAAGSIIKHASENSTCIRRVEKCGGKYPFLGSKLAVLSFGLKYSYQRNDSESPKLAIVSADESASLGSVSLSNNSLIKSRISFTFAVASCRSSNSCFARSINTNHTTNKTNPGSKVDKTGGQNPQNLAQFDFGAPLDLSGKRKSLRVLDSSRTSLES